MSEDLMPGSDLSAPTPDTNPALTGNLVTFGDIDPQHNLTDVQCRAIELLLRGMRTGAIAESLRINRKTLWHWKTQNPDFAKALSDARAFRFFAATDRCRDIAYRAAAVL